MNKEAESWRKQFRILAAGFIILILLLTFGIIVQFEENKKIKKAYNELMITQFGFLDACMDLSNVSIEEIQMIYFDEKVKEMREELLNG